MTNSFDLLMFNPGSGGGKRGKGKPNGTLTVYRRVNRENRSGATSRANRRKQGNPNQMSLF